MLSKDIDIVIKEILSMDGNETNLLESGEDYQRFSRFLTNMVKKRYDIRWCSRVGCPCHPEHSMRRTLRKDSSLVQFLSYMDNYGLLEEVVFREYEGKTVFDGYEVPLYTVALPDPARDGEPSLHCLGKRSDGSIGISLANREDYRDLEGCQLSEAEIKENHSYLWELREEVEGE